MASDPKPRPRVRDSATLRRLHLRWRECVICGTGRRPLSLHHISKHPRDDVEANLVMTCGSGTTGCHGRIEARDPVILRLLRDHIEWCRPDTIEYLDALGPETASDWLDRLAA